MLSMKELIKILVKLIESKLQKSGIEEAILKNQNYITIAKQIWRQIDEDYRITEKVEDKLKSKAEQFDAKLLSKFPELTQDDITDIRQALAGEINEGKTEVVSNSTLLQQLQSSNVQLTQDKATLQSQVDSANQTIAQMQQTIDGLNSKLNAINSAIGVTGSTVQ
jgi:chromosome segregation ATPase